MKMRKIVFYTSISVGLFLLVANPSFFEAKPIISEISFYNNHRDSINDARLLEQRIFPLFYEIRKDDRLLGILQQNAALEKLFQAKELRLKTALKNCPDIDCLAESLFLSNGAIDSIINYLSKNYSPHQEIKDFVANQIRPQHVYEFYSNYSDSALFIEAWKQELEGLNYIYNAYLKNTNFIYPKIDSALYNVKSEAYFHTIKNLVSGVLKAQNNISFVFPLLEIGEGILQINKRDEAIRFLPLSKYNAEAYGLIPKINWEKYKYSAILIPGKGPEDSLRISNDSKDRCRMGSALLRENKAPLIVVSGGYVHPYMTKYCEAEEMKRFLIDSLGVLEKNVIMEPHARHTTTNIRNTNRILLDNYVPRAKPILVVTDNKQISYMASNRFLKVFRRDMGIITFNSLTQISDTTIEYFPSMSSFQVNSREPLDP